MSAFVPSALSLDDAEAASTSWRLVADHVSPHAPASLTESKSRPPTIATRGRTHSLQCRVPHGTSAVVNIHEPQACGHSRPTVE